MTGPGSRVRRVLAQSWRLARFAVYFAGEFIRANLEVLWEVIRPRQRAEPAVVALPLASRTSREIITLTNLLTLTPGTLVLEISLDPPILYIHGMFVHDRDVFIADLQDLETRMLVALRSVDRR